MNEFTDFHQRSEATGLGSTLMLVANTGEVTFASTSVLGISVAALYNDILIVNGGDLIIENDATLELKLVDSDGLGLASSLGGEIREVEVIRTESFTGDFAVDFVDDADDYITVIGWWDDSYWIGLTLAPMESTSGEVFASSRQAATNMQRAFLRRLAIWVIQRIGTRRVETI